MNWAREFSKNEAKTQIQQIRPLPMWIFLKLSHNREVSSSLNPSRKSKLWQIFSWSTYRINHSSGLKMPKSASFVSNFQSWIRASSASTHSSCPQYKANLGNSFGQHNYSVIWVTLLFGVLTLPWHRKYFPQLHRKKKIRLFPVFKTLAGKASSKFPVPNFHLP